MDTLKVRPSQTWTVHWEHSLLPASFRHISLQWPLLSREPPFPASWTPWQIYQHRKRAIPLYADTFIRHIQPTLQLEKSPPVQQFIGRSQDVETCRKWIQDNQTIALRGASGIGKTTLIKKIHSTLVESGLEVRGFYTEELRSGGQRLGFEE